ncbi:MAG TPA: permease-like cell division protein FtsX [Steroidobacteraceae bacterium]|nr:permease-like cell division protein FtsX [Steroidobacteraceae bacterium]
MSSTIGNWVTRHGHALRASLGQLARHGVASALTVLAIGLALALPLALQVLVDNVGGIGGSLADSLGLSVYMKPQISEAAARQLASAVRARRDVARVTLISAAQGLAILRQQPDLGAALDALSGNENPLPNVLEVHPAASATSPARLDALRAALAAEPGVDTVQLDRDWALRFNAIMALARRLLWLGAVLLALGVLVVIGNTVRLEIQGRREEIELTKLVGGSNAYARRPFLYAGVLYGVVAALLAWGIVTAVCLALADPVGHLAAAYGSHFALRGPDRPEIGILIGAGALLGWLGAAIAAGRQIARIQPRPA